MDRRDETVGYINELLGKFINNDDNENPLCLGSVDPLHEWRIIGLLMISELNRIGNLLERMCDKEEVE